MTWPGKFESKHINSMTMDGTIVLAATAGTTGNIRVILRDRDLDILFATGTDVPTDATSGYAKGCIFIDRDVTTGSTGFYENVGTNTSSNFDQVGSQTTLADDAISLEHLDSGITPSHVVKYSGEVTWTGSGTSIATTVTGALATDIVQATIQSAPTEAAYLVSCAVTANTVTTTLSAANTSNDAVISYTVYRAAA